MARPRPIYRYSVIPGGVYGAVEVEAALSSDPVVARHYAGIDRTRVRASRLRQDTSAYVSFRIGDHIYWTRESTALREGETVLTDGVNLVRARCGNRISFTPMQPTTAMEPVPTELDRVTEESGRLANPGEGWDVLEYAPAFGRRLTPTSVVGDGPAYLGGPHMATNLPDGTLPTVPMSPSAQTVTQTGAPFCCTPVEISDWIDLMFDVNSSGSAPGETPGLAVSFSTTGVDLGPGLVWAPVTGNTAPPRPAFEIPQTIQPPREQTDHSDPDSPRNEIPVPGTPYNPALPEVMIPPDDSNTPGDPGTKVAPAPEPSTFMLVLITFAVASVCFHRWGRQ